MIDVKQVALRLYTRIDHFFISPFVNFIRCNLIDFIKGYRCFYSL